MINKYFDSKEHIFLIGKKGPPSQPVPNNVIHCHGIIRKSFLVHRLYNAQRIYLHGLYDSHFLYLLFLQPWLLKKCYWLIWGDDLYQHLTPPKSTRRIIKEKIRSFLIHRFGHIVTYIKGDYNLAQKWYGAKGKLHECLLYESNTYTGPSVIQSKTDGHTRIIVGNSAYPRNNHYDALDKIKKYADSQVIIYAPLSYGPPSEAKKVSAYGHHILGAQFIPLTEFMPINEYNRLLATIDIGIFNQDRQQAMGNMITLLGMGKTVYIKPGTTPWNLFSSIGFKIKDANEFDMSLLDPESILNNIELAKKHFSKNALIEQYAALFDIKGHALPKSAENNK